MNYITDLHINRTKSIAELLLGKDCINSTGYELKFKVGTIRKLLCEKTLTKAEVAKFRDALKREFEYQMSYRKFSLRAMVGSVEKSVVSKPRYYLVTHVRFYPRFLENKVKDINVVEDFGSAVDITEDVEVKVSFTYSVFWKAVKVNLNNSNTLPLNETSSQEDLSLTQENGSSVSWMFLPSIIVLWSVLLLLLLLPYFRSYFTRYHDIT